MQHIRVNLSRGGRADFLAALMESGIAFTERHPQAGAIVASTGAIEIIGAIGAPLAAVLVQWLRGRASRSVTIQTRRNEFVSVKGYSADDVTKILKDAVSMNVIQTTKDDP